jgi:hypothetical protein
MGSNVIRVVGVSYNVGVRYTVAGAICLHLRCAPTICRHASQRYARDLPTYKADTYAQTLARMHKPQHVCSNPRHVCSNSRYVCSNPSISLSCLSTDTSAQSNPLTAYISAPTNPLTAYLCLNCLSLPCLSAILGAQSKCKHMCRRARLTSKVHHDHIIVLSSRHLRSIKITDI